MMEHRSTPNNVNALQGRMIKRSSEKLTERFHGYVSGLPPYLKNISSDIPAIITVGGGKGGVGKSIFSANFAARLGQMGMRVLVVDMDLGCSNLHTHFGINMPAKSLADFVVTEKHRFDEVIHSCSVPNVGVIPCGREDLWTEHLEGSPEQMMPLWRELFGARQRFQVDIVVLDLGAGTSRLGIDFFCAAHLGVATVLPEPTSIENAYVFIKAVLWQLLDNVAQRFGHQQAALEVKQALSKSGGSFNHGYADCLRRMAADHPDYISMVFNALAGRNLGILINQSRSQSDIEIGASMEHICRRYFGFQSADLGYLNYDDTAWKSLRNRRLMVVDFPHSMLSKRLTKVTMNALSMLGFLGGGHHK